MQDTLLIADGVSSNRILLQAKLAPSSFDLAHAASAADLVKTALRLPPALIVVSDTLPDARAEEVCARLRAENALRTTPIITIARSPDGVERLRLLRAGADDVFAHPLSGTVLRARVRSLVRARTLAEELSIREGTSRALGFAEAQEGFSLPAQVTLLAHQEDLVGAWQAALRPHMPRARFTGHAFGQRIAPLGENRATDVFAIGLGRTSAATGLRLLSDIRAHPSTRHAAIVAIVENGEKDTLGANALDLGAGDLMIHGFEPRELALRLNTQVFQKRAQDQLRASVESGLRAAVRDPMTGLYNRRYALPYLKRLIQTSQEGERRFAVMLADLDHFKRINDSYGHASGDAVLIEAAKRLQDDLRAEDLIARIGGEEFLIVLPDATREDAQHVAERVRSRINATPFELPDHSDPVTLSISIGLAIHAPELNSPNTAPKSAEDLLRLADAALYSSKDGGRNQVTLIDSAANAA